MKQSYQTMPIHEFGEALIRTGDLDPVYGIVPRDPALRKRWLLAYWCFYHTGAASYISEHEGEDYWRLMLAAAANETSPPVKPGGRWPRASERRYFRGPKCVKAVEWFWNQWDTPEEVIDHLVGVSQDPGLPRTEKTVMRTAQEWPLFGPWIGFKIADMLERCCGVPVQFSQDIGLIYKEPRAGLDLLAQSADNKSIPPETWYEYLLSHFGAFRAPPRDDRPCGPQEVETILCKWKSHMNGHYRVGKDILEVSHALQGWGDVAFELYKQLPDDMQPED